MAPTGRVAALVLTATLAGSAAAADETAGNDRPYAQLREGYAAADPELAAGAYAEDAAFAELYPGTGPVLRSGRAAIAEGFASLFGALGMSRGVSGADLNFRFAARGPAGDVGYYRLRIGQGAAARSFYGSFATRISNGRFVSDTSGPGDLDGFEGASGPVLFAPDDEELEPVFYDRLLGVYGKPDCPVVITRSARRLFALEECTGQWRGLHRLSGREWSAGRSLIDPAALVRYSFVGAASLKITKAAGPPVQLERLPAFRTEAVRFGNDPSLAGTLYLPGGSTARPVPAVAMIHGSGPQDRHGHASLIGLIAQRLARNGIAVLAYDKRGTGGSGGEWNRAGFAELAADAAAAMQALRTHSAIDPARVGLAGSSQAGWVAAEAVRRGAKPAFVMLIGAAGAALSVEEQNLYNTRVRMECAGIGPGDVRLALDQQRAFFATRRDPSEAARLARLSAQARARPGLQDWLFPATVEPGASSEWYDVLDVDFDPLPVWRSYPGKAYMVFGGSDDSTPAALAARRLASVKAASVTVVPGMHHIGLRARSVCESDIAGLSQFHPRFLATLDQWSREVTGRK